MNDFDPKEKSKGLGDTIAKITHATGIDKAAEAIAKAAGADDCGCNKRRKTLNEILPYTKKSELKQPHINTKPLNEIIGKYEVLQEIHCTLPVNGKITFNVGSILLIDENHPLYKDIPFYYKNNVIKKL